MAKRRGTKQNKKYFFKYYLSAFLLLIVPRKDQLAAGCSILCYLFLYFNFFSDSSEFHWFIHSRGFADQFERNHVLRTKKTLKITLKVFFYLPHILTRMSHVSSISRHILCICCFSFFLGHNELQAE